MIAAKPEWEFAGLYADEGISGTRADKRPQFQKMINDCLSGKIDYIITKSVSRFARNTVDCLDHVRMLRARGIGIYFEEQNIDTLQIDSELYLVIYAGFAQSESESISKNVTWTFRIISRELFHKTQEELARRMSREPNSTKTATTATGKYSRYALSNVMICAECGSRYKRVTWTSRGKKRVVWRCISRLDYGKRYCKTSLTVDETALHAAIVRAINRFNEEDESTYMALMRATIGEAIGLTGGTDEIDLLRRKIDGLNRKMVSLINESVESGEGIESHEAEFKELSNTIELLQGRIQKLEEALASDQVNDSRILQLQQIIADRASKKMEYDDTIVHQMIECVKVYPDGRLDIIFGGGYLIEERLEKEN